MMTPLKKLLAVLLAALIVVAIVTGFTWAVVLAWNCVAASLFHLPLLHFWQMFAILFLLGVVKRLFIGQRHPTK